MATIAGISEARIRRSAGGASLPLCGCVALFTSAMVAPARGERELLRRNARGEFEPSHLFQLLIWLIPPDNCRMATPTDDADPKAPGAEIVAVRVSVNPPSQFSGTIVAARPLAIAARFPGVTFEQAETVVLFCGPLGARLMARGVLLRSQGDACAFQLTSAFQPFDARKIERVPTSLSVEVRSVIGNSRQRGTMVDLSTGGLAVALPAKPGGRAIEVFVTANGFSAALPCETVGVTPQDEGVILHLRFEELSPPRQAFVRLLVSTARAALDPSLQQAAS